MEQVKQDITKLYSITDYAKKQGVTRQTVYNWIADKEKQLKVVVISGKQFIKLSA
jgi:DNA invertase Pin-like site-specific DNA recombinase